MKTLYTLIIVSSLLSCNSSEKKLIAQDIIDKAITVHCNGNCEKSTVTFKFRDKIYKSIKADGLYQCERKFSDSINKIKDVLSNTGFKRYINDSLVKLPDTLATTYANSVNSVHYFAQLPYGLNAPAAKKELLGETTIKGKMYYEIGVTFREEGGGSDYEDTFVYWINKADFSLDYLAYSFAENGGGIRFREAYNKRIINNITFLDYNNYKPETKDVDLKDLDTLFEAGKLQFVSKIETEDVKVILNK
nr:DUF6503 family protein [Jejuia pallidilutea]